MHVMKTSLYAAVTSFLALTLAVNCARCAEELAAPLPQGVRAVWDIDKAFHESTSTRERICLNGLWRWQPAPGPSDATPPGNWGFFKVPGSWPGVGDYMQKDSQTLYVHPDWKERRLGAVTAAWYERRITIPREWADRRISLEVEYLNSFAVVYVDGKKAGEMRFPGGEVNLSSVCRAGSEHTLSIYVAA